ncbi:putative sensor domain DACNV-containing protein [Pedobacter alpinus]|uniref:Sensor domain DACNV-containing protein n=1 Tax=Pedobacter alpinus TaxID=1590643 RepID=A0ABW5TQZ8_9SPHI
MSKTTYQAANTASPIIEAHFNNLIGLASAKGELGLADAPNQKIISEIINAAFWASLRKEEGKSPKISIAFLAPEQAEQPLVFGVKFPLNAANLTKIAPGIERAGIHLGVWEENGFLYIWGTTLKIPNFCFVLDVSEPGLIVVKHRRLHGFGKYTNVAVLKGDEIKVIDKDCGTLKECPPIVTALLDIDAPCTFNNGVNVFIQLAVSMRAHQHGGILLVVPPNSSDWKRSIVHPLQYPLHPSFDSLATLLNTNHTEYGEVLWQAALRNEVENIAGLTAIDGATVVSRDHHLHTFGAKIVRSSHSTTVEQVLYIEPIINGEEVRKYIGEIGGTRHLSAAQFVHDQHDAVALVASQDGHFTVFSWSLAQEMVQAYRIDTLLI